MHRGIGVLTFLVVVGLVLPSAALASDATTTQTYLRANYALVKTASSHLKASEAAPYKILAQVQRECPRAALSSPQNPESTQLSNELIGDMVLTAGMPDRQAIQSFVSTAARLRWSNSGLSREVRAYVSDLKTLLALKVPNVCGDVSAWATNGFRALPTTTVAFDARFMPAWVALGYVPSRLSKYEDSTAKSLARRANHLEEELVEGEARAVEPWGEIMNALVLNP